MAGICLDCHYGGLLPRNTIRPSTETEPANSLPRFYLQYRMNTA